MTTAPPAWSLLENAPLLPFNTFHVRALAPRLLRIADARALPQALTAIGDVPLLVLGSGSNVLLAANPDDVVLVFDNRDIGIIGHQAGHALVRAGAGAIWHELVMWSLAQGLSGLENLALIPGTVGAAPIQNIGAYGAQAGEFIWSVEAWDRQRDGWVRLDQAACRFGYRDSLFKTDPDRYLITAVEFRLPLRHGLRLDYAGIREQLQAMAIDLPTAADVARAVIAIRQRKLPDPAVLGNAGSFFKNPILPFEQVRHLLQDYPELPVYPGSDADSRKLSAAWMIEACGWKGRREGDAGVSPDHALVLVNHGSATGSDLLALARRISASVREKFGVAIEPEPRLVGAHW